MGQFALGLRSLLIKAAVFVVMAALLAWALGGTLWPRPSRAEFPAITVAEKSWYWRLTVGENDSSTREDQVRWELYRLDDNRPVVVGDAAWYEVAGPVAAAGIVYFGGRPAELDPQHSQWMIVNIDAATQQLGERHPMPDRLAVEQQLARLAAGLPLQDPATILQQRHSVLDPQ